MVVLSGHSDKRFRAMGAADASHHTFRLRMSASRTDVTDTEGVNVAQPVAADALAAAVKGRWHLAFGKPWLLE